MMLASPQCRGPQDSLLKGRLSMIGAATYTTDWDDVPCWALHRERDDIYPGTLTHYCAPYSARPNVTGPRQTRCHDFPDVLPVEQPEAVRDDPGESAERPASTTTGEALPVRGEDAYWRTRWFLVSEDSPLYDWLADVTSTMQTADRQDMRQDVCMTSWQYSVSAQYRGGRGVPSARSVRTLAERWLKRHDKTDAPFVSSVSRRNGWRLGDTEGAEWYREMMGIERAAITREVLKREQSRIVAEHAQSNPPAALVFTW